MGTPYTIAQRAPTQPKITLKPKGKTLQPRTRTTAKPAGPNENELIATLKNNQFPRIIMKPDLNRNQQLAAVKAFDNFLRTPFMRKEMRGNPELAKDVAEWNKAGTRTKIAALQGSPQALAFTGGVRATYHLTKKATPYVLSAYEVVTTFIGGDDEGKEKQPEDEDEDEGEKEDEDSDEEEESGTGLFITKPVDQKYLDLLKRSPSPSAQDAYNYLKNNGFKIAR